MTATVQSDPWCPNANIDRWLLVSTYCDRWCERCRHRTRCLMAGMEPEQLFSLDEEPEPSEEELDAEGARIAEAIREALEAEGFPVAEVEAEPLPAMDDDPLMASAQDWWEISQAWMASLPQGRVEGETRELVEVLTWYSSLVPNKLYRALIAEQFEERYGPPQDPHPRDALGSAKVAALGLYACIGTLSGWCKDHRLDGNAMAILMTTCGLLEMLQRRFPDHMEFMRPGFDEG